MNNIIDIKDPNAFQNVINNFNRSISNIEKLLDDDKRLFDNLEKEKYWKGNLQEEFCNKNKELSDHYGTIVNSLTELSSFMQDSLNKFYSFDSSLGNEMDNNKTNLDVNS